MSRLKYLAIWNRRYGVISQLPIITNGICIIFQTLVHLLPRHPLLKLKVIGLCFRKEWDEPGHVPSQIRAFTVSFIGSLGPKHSSGGHGDYSDHTGQMSRLILRLRWTHWSFCFCHTAAHIDNILILIIYTFLKTFASKLPDIVHVHEFDFHLALVAITHAILLGLVRISLMDFVF